jgi:sporulation protein YlmC with PRC-barrel domain
VVERAVFAIGTEVTCTDGPCGELTRVVVDPIARAVTHLVVEPKHRSGLGKLVSLDLVEATPEEIRLACTLAAFDELEAAEETQFVPGSNGGYGGYGLGQAVAWPYFSQSSFGVAGGGIRDAFEPVVYDSVPLGEVVVRRDQPVHATDGEIGRVQGLVVDPHNHRVTHVLLQEGHLWGRKDVAIPVTVVARFDNGVALSITKQEVGDLPAIEIDHLDGQMDPGAQSSG